MALKQSLPLEERYQQLLKHSASLSNDTVALSLATVDPADSTTFITNAQINAHMKVVFSSSNITDVIGNAFANTTVTEAGGSHTRDTTAPSGYTSNLTADSDSNSDNFAPSTGYDDDTTIDFSVSGAVDTGCGLSATPYKYKLDTGSYSSWTSATTVQYTAQSDGTHTVYMTVRDNSDNESEKSVSVVVDTALPAAATVSAPISTTYVVADAVPSVFQGDVGDNAGGSGVEVNKAQFSIRNLANDETSRYWDGTDWDSTEIVWLTTTNSANTAANTSLWSDSVELPTWVDKETYFVRARAVDKAGNVLGGIETAFYYDTISSVAALSAKLGITGSETVSSKLDLVTANVSSEADITQSAIASVASQAATAQAAAASAKIAADSAAAQAVATQAAVASQAATTQAAVSTIGSTVTSNIAATETALKTKVALESASRILNQQSSILNNGTLVVRYKTTPGLTPVISVYDPAHNKRISDKPMTETVANSSGVYQYDVKFIWGTGQHTIVCQEVGTGTLDGMNIEVASTDLDTISDALTTATSTLAGVNTDELKSLDLKVAEINTFVTSMMSNMDKLTTLKTRSEILATDASDAIYKQLEIATNKLKEINDGQGIKIKEVYDLTEEQAVNTEYIKNKALEIKALVELSQDILSRTSDEPIVKSWLESGIDTD